MGWAPAPPGQTTMVTGSGVAPRARLAAGTTTARASPAGAGARAASPVSATDIPAEQKPARAADVSGMGSEDNDANGRGDSMQGTPADNHESSLPPLSRKLGRRGGLLSSILGTGVG